MRMVPGPLVALMVMAVALAGCTAEPAPTPAAQDPTVTESTGSVKGKVVTTDLEPVVGATVALLAGPDIVQDATTGDNGLYVFNDVAPGSYRVQVSSVCCEAAAREVTVHAGDVASGDLQLTPLSSTEKGEPFMVDDEWTGFIECGYSSPVLAHALCATLGSPNDDFLHEFTIGAGVEEIVIGMEWDPTGGVSGENLRLLFEEVGGDCTEEYADVRGAPPLEIRYREEETDCFENFWANVTDEQELRFRVFPTGEATVVYQQAFTVRWYVFHNAPAPEGFSPFPDA